LNPNLKKKAVIEKGNDRNNVEEAKIEEKFPIVEQKDANIEKADLPPKIEQVKPALFKKSEFSILLEKNKDILMKLCKNENSSMEHKFWSGFYQDRLINSKNSPNDYYSDKFIDQMNIAVGILEKVHSTNDKFSILELGSNCGKNLNKIRERFNGCETFGTDINDDAVKMAEEKYLLPNMGCGDTRSVVKFLYEKEFMFDTILSVSHFMHINHTDFNDIVPLLPKICRNLILIEDNPPEADRWNLWPRNYDKIFNGKAFEYDCKKLGNYYVARAYRLSNPY